MSSETDWIEDSSETDCDDCENMKQAVLAQPGAEWLGCEPVPDKPGRCLAKWRLRA